MNAYYEIFKENKPDSKYTLNWLGRVRWARIFCNGTKCILKSNRTREDEDKFIKTLQTIEYDDGYGIQHLFGTIVFTNGVYWTRWEYDGSEGWESHSVPEEPDWDE